ncbi:Putative membrane protein [Paucilactobacillus oligofermentans DSM 15707 = LMG 22743]|uniref:acyltransferase family protein n=1 Tax=Paucilactobacillus oligofermentans TaxID=293371 RepID=UPI00070A40E7|nr:acyltransferase [Paucilactobacillus oligofermentans]CUS26949.1 Putative membrane protein [Paucilactobacillus oligofermentans DSM 15707 = LMG 22743]
MDNKRNSSIELLRIFAIFMIVISHLSLYGNWNVNNLSVIKKTELLMFEPLGSIGAAIFFIITGYFSYSNHQIISLKIQKSLQKVLTIWTEVIFYSLIICFIAIFLLQIKPNLLLIAKAIFPICLNEYWFVTAYVLLMILEPFIVETLITIDKRIFLYLIIILYLCLFLGLANNDMISRFSITIASFLIGAYIRKYSIKIDILKTKFLFLFVCVLYLFELLILYVMNYIGISFLNSLYFTNFVLPVFIASFIFILSIRQKEFNKASINSISKCVFAVYLITEHPMLRNILWNDVVNPRRFQNSLWFPIFSLIITISIFLVCCAIDMVRQSMFKLFKINKVREIIVARVLKLIFK